MAEFDGKNKELLKVFGIISPFDDEINTFTSILKYYKEQYEEHEKKNVRSTSPTEFCGSDIRKYAKPAYNGIVFTVSNKTISKEVLTYVIEHLTFIILHKKIAYINKPGYAKFNIYDFCSIVNLNKKTMQFEKTNDVNNGDTILIPSDVANKLINF
jgi:hypothetical protein